MKTAMILALLTIAGCAMVTPSASALNCTQHVNAYAEVGGYVTVHASVDPDALAYCAARTVGVEIGP